MLDAATIDWFLEPHPIPVELTPDYRAEPYTPRAATFFPPLADRIDEVMRGRLADMYGSI